MLLGNRQVTLATVASALAWSLGGLTIVLGIVWNRNGIAPLGLWVSSWGIVTMLAHHHESSNERDREIFDTGRRIGQSDQDERNGSLSRI